jgi:hypothetical protein
MLRRTRDRVRAKFCSNCVDRFFPSQTGLFSHHAKARQCFTWRTAIAKNLRARLAADVERLLPLNGIEVMGDRRGHGVLAPQKLA